MTWPTATLKQLSIMGPQYGANLSAVEPNGRGVRYVRITDIDEFGQLRPESYVEPNDGDVSDYMLADGDLLLARSGATVGKSYLHTDVDGPCAFAGYLIRFRPNKQLALPKFLNYYTQTPNYWSWVSGKKRVAAQPNVNGAEYASLRIPLPPISEQRRIVELLNEANSLRRLRREADAKAACILPALFLRMFGEPATNPRNWVMKPLGDLADQRPEYGANASASPMLVDKPRYVRITDIQDDGSLSDKEVVSLDAEDWSRYLLQDGDVLFARSGNTVGKTYIYRPEDGPCTFAGYLIRFQFRSGAVDPWYIFGLTRTAYYRGWVESHKRVGGQPNINGPEYASLLVPEPPKCMQERFGRVARDIESVLETASAAAGKLEVTFDTMLQHAFSGQLTAKWREAHMKELLAEMQQQAHALNLPMPKDAAA